MKQLMKKNLILITGAAMCFAIAPATFAQPVNNDQNDNSTMYVPNVNLTSLSQNQFNGSGSGGIVGGQIITPYYFNVSVNYLGYADPTSAALTTSHTITIWSASNSGYPGGGAGGGDGTPGSVIASATVPAGTPTMWANGYAWVQIPTVTLSYESTYNVGATVVAGQDNWGNLLQNTQPDTGSGSQITWNVSPNGTGPDNFGTAYGPFVQIDTSSPGNYAQAIQGIYDNNASDAGNANPTFNLTGAPDSIYSAVNLGYNLTTTAVPEPGSLALISAGAALFAGLALKRKANKRSA